KALRLPDRAEKGMRPTELWKTVMTGKFMASPLYRDGLLYTIESQKCRLITIEAKTGKIVEATRTEEPGLKIDGLAPAHHAYASPTADEKHLFFFDDAGNAAVIEHGRNPKVVRVNKLQDGVVGTPFFVNDRIIIRGSQAVYCVGEKR